jgi:hypothetical protein
MFKHASMNRAFRIVWNEARQCFMVASELTKSRGKASSSGVRKVVADALVAAALTLGLGSAAWGATTTVSTYRNVGVNLPSGNSLEVTNLGTLAPPYPPYSAAVMATHGPTVGFIRNEGTISNNIVGVYVGPTLFNHGGIGPTVQYGLTNSGFINGPYTGVAVVGSGIN